MQSKRPGVGKIFASIVAASVTVMVLSGAFGSFYASSTPTITTTPISTTTATIKITFTVYDNSVPFAFISGSQRNPSVTVSNGDIIEVTLNNNGTQAHNWVLEGYNVSTKTVIPGQSDSITFSADKTGTFTYYCSVPGHEELGMKGQFIVK